MLKSGNRIKNFLKLAAFVIALAGNFDLFGYLEEAVKKTAKRRLTNQQKNVFS